MTPATDPRATVRELAEAVRPGDDQEAAHQADIIGWIDSGAPLFRTVRPATPPKHLAVYAALLDETARSVLVVNHRKARLWVLPGGHVDDGEDPRQSVEREVLEELGITPGLRESTGQPCFLSVGQTRPPDSHTDVTLWFVFNGDRSAQLRPDLREFSEARWLSLDHTDWSQYDPNMDRFKRKLAG